MVRSVWGNLPMDIKEYDPRVCHTQSQKKNTQNAFKYIVIIITSIIIILRQEQPQMLRTGMGLHLGSLYVLPYNISRLISVALNQIVSSSYAPHHPAMISQNMKKLRQHNNRDQESYWDTTPWLTNFHNYLIYFFYVYSRPI